MTNKEQAIINNGILGALRRYFSRCIIHTQVKKDAIHPREKGPKGGKRYICSVCGDHHSSSSINVDHIDPVIPFNKTARDMSWDEIIKRMFCGKDNLQVLCKECHDIKTKQEKKERSKHVRKKKEK